MDEQMNEVIQPRRRRRRENRPAETDWENAAAAPVEDIETETEETKQDMEPQLLFEDDSLLEDDMFDDEADDSAQEEKRGKSGCLIFVLVALLVVVIAAAAMWFAFPDQSRAMIDKVVSVVAPTAEPTATPTAEPTATPTAEPTATPTAEPTATPTAEPTATPTAEPTATPTAEPTATPTAKPTATPTAEPTATPTAKPTATPTTKPTPIPTPRPTAVVTLRPTAPILNKATAVPAVKTTAVPAVKTTAAPTTAPTAVPTAAPTAVPTAAPTATPTVAPTAVPTPAPTAAPTATPYVAAKAAPAQGTEPSNLIKESRVIVEGKENAGFVQQVSMGDPNNYSAQGGVLTFRGDPLRQNAAYGTVEVEQQQLKVTRGMRTGILGNEFSGFGYGSQPLIVKWYKNIREMMDIKADCKDTTAFKEVILPSADGKIYFFNLETQVYSRDILDVGFPLDTTGAVNPYGYPLLYVGQKEDEVGNYRGIVGMRIYDLINNEMLAFETGLSSAAYEDEVGTICASPVVEANSDTLIYGADNGMLYTVDMNTAFDLEKKTIAVDPVVASYAYKTNVSGAKQGIPAGAAVYGDYAYFGDMAGTIQCVDLNTLKPVWVLDMGDSVVGSVAIEIEGDGVYLYAGNVLNMGKRSEPVNLVKINALTGEIVWKNTSVEAKYSSKLGDGVYAGLMASPLVGEGDISDLVIFSVNNAYTEEKNKFYAMVYALDKTTGEEVWSQPVDVNSISSPIAMYEADGTSHIVLGDESGTLRLMDGFTGTAVSTVNLGSAIQSSPAAYDNTIVVGTTDGMIYFVELK